MSVIMLINILSLQLSFALFINIVRVLLVKMKSNYYLERRRLRYRLVSCKVQLKLTAVCQSFSDIFNQVKPTPSKRSRSTHYSILETYGYNLSTIKVFTEISTGLLHAFRCIEIHQYSSSIIHVLSLRFRFNLQYIVAHKQEVSQENILIEGNVSRSQWPCGLRRRSVATRLLRSWVRIPPGAWMFVCCECCVLSGRGLCDELITRPEKSYRLRCVVVCDLETSRMRRPWPALGRSATGDKEV